MPGLARLIEFHKEKSHIIRSVLNTNLEDNPKVEVEAKPCPVLHEAIGELRADQLRREHIPDAIAQLKEIRAVTEQSVDVIMEQAEVAMDKETTMNGAVSILEACSFQDLVGQRVSKVSELLENLEERFHGLINETGIADNMETIGDEELAIESRRKELILHGPQLTGVGVTQEEIDALLGA